MAALAAGLFGLVCVLGLGIYTLARPRPDPELEPIITPSEVTSPVTTPPVTTPPAITPPAITPPVAQVRPTKLTKLAKAPSGEELLARITSLTNKLSAAREVDKNAQALLRRYRLQASGELDLPARRNLTSALDRWEAEYLKH